jgi:signal transduction histidine kinase
MNKRNRSVQAPSAHSARRIASILGNTFNLLFVIAFIGVLFYFLGIQSWLGTANQLSIHICISFACGGMLMMAIYNSALRLFSRREKAALYFSLFCLGQSVRFFFIPGSVGEVLFPSLHPVLILCLRSIPYTLAILGVILFAYEIFGESRSKAVKYAVIIAVIAVNLVFLIFGLHDTVWRAMLGMPVGIFININCVYVIARSPLLKKDRLSVLYLIGYLLYFISFTLVMSNYSEAPVIAVPFNFLFAVIHAVLLSSRFARAIEEVEQANVRLEDRVAERTMELSEANANLAASEQNIRDMARAVSHEVRTPLTVMSTYAQLAIEQLNRGHVDEQTLLGLVAISEEAQRLAELSSNALSPKGEKETVVNLAEIAGQLARLLQPVAEKNQQELVVTLEKALLTYGNAGEITQVLWNLIDNALKYSGEGSIEIEGNLNDEHAYIIVADYGCGINPDLMPRVLERGVTDGKGQGLGLAISHEIVERHGGNLLIESEPGLGTKATMLLPVYRRKVGEEYE